jgi:H+/Cl- antiporter ClcA
MLKPTKHHEPLSTAKAVVGILVLGIAFVLFWKFMTNQDVFFEDIEALRNYVIFTIVVCGFLVGLLYLSSQTTHKTKITKAKVATKTKTSKKKKK